MKILPYQRQYCSQYCTYTTDVREVHRVQWHVCSLHCKYWSLPHWMMAESEEEEKDATVLRWCIGPVATDGDCYWKRVDRNNSPKSVGLQRGASTVFLQPQRHLKSTVRKKTVQQSLNSDERYGWCRVRDESAISRCQRAGADGPSVFVASCSAIPRRAPSFADIALPRQDVSCFCYFSWTRRRRCRRC